MNRKWAILITGLFLTVSSIDQALALEPEGLAERDLTVKEAVDPSSGAEKVEIGEVEKETEHDVLFERETHESVHESGDVHESIRESTHDSSGIANERESSGGTHDPVERP